MPDLVIDIGANQGEFAIEIATRNPGLDVLAVEPIPELCARIEDGAHARGAGNVRTRCLAIDATGRAAEFHVADHADQGVSSLLRFHDEGLRADEYWRQREDLHFERTIAVDVRRLDALPEVVAAPRIRFLKIDAQGVDLAVLASLGEHRSRLEAGMLEVPATRGTRLYAEERHDLGTAIAQLREWGFEVHAIKPNDPAANECNVYFHRRDLDPKVIEQELGLRSLRLYDGKHYWHLPSGQLHPEAVTTPDAFLARCAAIEAALAVATARLQLVEEALARECEETNRLGAAVTQRDTQIQLMQLAAGRFR